MSGIPFFMLPLDVPNYPADRYAPLADRLRRLLATQSELVFIQAEALLALEASAISLARPGVTALNIVTSPYGAYFGTWLRRGGATVHRDHRIAGPNRSGSMPSRRHSPRGSRSTS